LKLLKGEIKTMNEFEKFLTVTEAYKPLGYTDRQGLYRDIRIGNWTAYVRIGGKIRIPASAVREWTQKQIKQNEVRADEAVAA